MKRVLFLLAAAVLAALPGAALAVDANTCGYNQGNGGWYKAADRSGPYSLDGNCNATLIGAGGAGGSGSTVVGSQEQDVRATQTLNAATLNAAITLPLNGQGTVGLTFTGLTASGATLTYEQSIDGGTTWTGVNEVNAGTGVPSATRTTDGQVRVSASGRTNLRMRVSAVGTGTITVASNISVREGMVTLASPLPPGTNAIGTVVITALPAGSQTTTGALQPPTAASGKIVDTSVALTANTSTTLVAARATAGDRLAVEIQCDGAGVVGIDMKGGTLTSATAAPRVIPSGSYPLYTPPIATQTAITAYTGTAQTCRVTEYLR